MNKRQIITDPFGFDARWGLYYDAETGLYLATYRYYDPANGRFLNRDPINFAGGLNQYAYTFNNYTSSDDSTGLTIYLCTRHVIPNLPCKNHSYQHWFIEVNCPQGPRCIGFERGGITIEKPPCGTNLGNAINFHCRPIASTLAQKKCLCTNCQCALRNVGLRLL